MDYPLVSIVVAIYKVEEYLSKCIQSVISQTYTNLEIILVDDGSPDNCPEICDKYAKQDSRIKIIHKKNEGSVFARRDGLNIASGKYALMVDGDDFMDPEYVYMLIVEAEKTQADVVVDSYLMSYPNREYSVTVYADEGIYKNEKLVSLKERLIYSGIFYEFGINPALWNKLFITEKLRQFYVNVPKNITLGEDFAVSMPYMMNTNSISIINSKAYYHYRQRDTSMMNQYDKHLNAKIEELICYLKNGRLNQVASEQLDYYYAWLFMCELKNIAKNKCKMFEQRCMIQNAYEKYGGYQSFERIEKLPLQYKMVFALLKGKRYMTVSVILKLVIEHYLRKE